jgi:hypothetical protein
MASSPPGDHTISSIILWSPGVDDATWDPTWHCHCRSITPSLQSSCVRPAFMMPHRILHGIVTGGRSQDSMLHRDCVRPVMLIPRTYPGVFLIKGRRTFYQLCHTVECVVRLQTQVQISPVPRRRIDFDSSSRRIEETTTYSTMIWLIQL